MQKEKLGKISQKIIEILGLEDYPLQSGEIDKDMLLIRNEDGEVIKGINFTDEVIELTQFIDDIVDGIEVL
jgi:hypothetical protein